MKKVFFVLAVNLMAASAFAQVGAAIASLQTGKLDQAKTQIDKASTDDKQGNKSKTWFYRGEVYKSIANDQTGLYAKLDTNALQVAYDSYKKAQELEPGSTFAKQAAEKVNELGPLAMNQGGTKYQANDFAGAARFFDMARMLNPKDTTATLYSGIAHQQNKDYRKAADSFEALIALGTNDPSIYNVLGSIYRSFEETDKALAVYKKGTEKFPANKQLKDEQFNLYIASGKMDEARGNLEEAVKREPNNPEYLKNLGILYDQSGDKAKAQEYYEKALALEPNSYDANFNLGVLHYNRGAEISQKVNAMDLKQYQKDGKRLEAELKQHFNKAIPHFEKCYQQKQDDASVLGPLEKIYRLLGRTADADKVAKQMQGAK